MLSRAEAYRGSDPLFPEARREERDQLIALLDVEPHHVVLDMPAWCGYLALGIEPLVANPEQIFCIDPAPGFLAEIPDRFHRVVAPQHKTPLPSRSIDRIGSLVGLHHVRDKIAVVCEMARVLRVGGRAALSEVETGSRVAAFLDGPVHEYTATGHRGMFVADGELTRLLVSAGFKDVSEQRCDLRWRFRSYEDMGRFCWSLLGMVKTAPEVVARLVVEWLDVEENESEISIGWPLRYATGVI